MGMAVGMRAWSAERCVNAASSSFRLSDCCASSTWMSSSCRPSSRPAVGGVWSVNSSSMTPEASGWVDTLGCAEASCLASSGSV